MLKKLGEERVWEEGEKKKRRRRWKKKKKSRWRQKWEIGRKRGRRKVLVTEIGGWWEKERERRGRKEKTDGETGRETREAVVDISGNSG